MTSSVKRSPTNKITPLTSFSGGWNTEGQIRIWVPGLAMAKLRPRARIQNGHVHIHNPAHYTAWKTSTAAQVRLALKDARKACFESPSQSGAKKEYLEQCWVRGNIALCPVECAKVEFLFVGAHRGDPSNRINGLLDVLIDPNLMGEDLVLQEDCTSKQPEGSYACDRSSVYRGTLIVITPTARSPFKLTKEQNKLNTWGDMGWNEF